MRKTTKLVILLLVVSVIYFGYSAWIDGASIFNITYLGGLEGAVKPGLESGGLLESNIGVAINTSSANWGKFILEINALFGLNMNASEIDSVRTALAENANFTVKGIFAHNSLAKSILDPFKMILVGGVFAMFIPLVKEIFFGTFMGIKNYLKARRTNVLYNYQKAITWTTDMKVKLESGNFEDIKAQYSTYGGLAFKPKFLDNMIDEIGEGVIKESDLSLFAKPCQVIIDSITEMYEKERRAAIVGRSDEMFFDLKRGYEYTSTGSKYSIAYFKAIDTKNETKSHLAWKLFSLEMNRFMMFLVVAIIPAIIVGTILGPVLGTTDLQGDIKTLVTSLTTMLIWFGSAIALHATFTLTKADYKNIKKEIIKVATVYYLLVILTAITISAGMVGMSKAPNMVEMGSINQIWVWFSALSYLVLSTSLVVYVIATLVDANRSPYGMTKKLLVDGIVLPLVAWTIATTANFTGLFLGDQHLDLKNSLAVANTAVLVGFWIYLSISGFLLNNIVLPSTKQKLALQAELAQQGKEAAAKKAAAKKSAE
ncbi:hypothetical protein [Mesoplasma photuris]|uniref:hypothetical protein n=1 Tax=Mesoplasma photuris TaxID=217731 RepID=UPI0004E1B600|nr:hypothetical protein [Mesoplasma photuris]